MITLNICQDTRIFITLTYSERDGCYCKCQFQCNLSNLKYNLIGTKTIIKLLLCSFRNFANNKKIARLYNVKSESHSMSKFMWQNVASIFKIIPQLYAICIRCRKFSNRTIVTYFIVARNWVLMKSECLYFISNFKE